MALALPSQKQSKLECLINRIYNRNTRITIPGDLESEPKAGPRGRLRKNWLSINFKSTQ